jgi:lipoprotein-anchoring transpeptidase ErfK/SrfK
VKFRKKFARSSFHTQEITQRTRGLLIKDVTENLLWDQSAIAASLPDQLLYVYRNGVRIGRSTVSTGKPGKSTPTGVFTVLQKKVSHTSSIYKGAQMPHMQRLTSSGIALHAGHLPGYPASAGCVRMPIDFAANLFTVTGVGTTVIIADNPSIICVWATSGNNSIV